VSFPPKNLFHLFFGRAKLTRLFASNAFPSGNGWASNGMLRVVGALQNSDYKDQYSSEIRDLMSWSQEIVDSAWKQPMVRLYSRPFVNDSRRSRLAARNVEKWAALQLFERNELIPRKLGDRSTLFRDFPTLSTLFRLFQNDFAHCRRISVSNPRRFAPFVASRSAFSGRQSYGLFQSAQQRQK